MKRRGGRHVQLQLQKCSLICSSWVRSPKLASWYEADLFYLFSFQQKQIQLLYVPSKLTWQITMISISIILRKGCDVNSTHLTFVLLWQLGYLSVLWDKLILLHSGKHRHHAKSCLSFFFFCILEKKQNHYPLAVAQSITKISAPRVQQCFGINLKYDVNFCPVAIGLGGNFKLFGTAFRW